MTRKVMRLALSDDIETAAEEHAQDIFERAQNIATEYDVEITTTTGVGYIAQTILARAEAFDMVVLGTHGRSLADYLFFSDVSHTIFCRSPVPVTVVR